MENMKSRQGGNNVHAKRYEDLVLDIREAAQLLQKPMSRVRLEAHAGELPVMAWEKDKPYFKAGELMELMKQPTRA